MSRDHSGDRLSPLPTVRTSRRPRRFAHIIRVQTGSGAQPTSYLMSDRAYFLRDVMTGYE